MKIWVDADACPQMVKEVIIRAVIKRKIPAEFVANKPLYLPASQYISRKQVALGDDIADQYIAEYAMIGDLVITQDIPLAAILVKKGIDAISPHGTLFNKDNIGERLSIRNFLHEARSQGVQTGGPKAFSLQDKQRFASAFDRQLTKLLPKTVAN